MEEFSNKTEENIYNLLKKLKIDYEEIVHDEVISSEDSFNIRKNAGWQDFTSAKNILFHAKGKFYLVVLNYDKVIKARIFKKEFGTKNIRFATKEELKEILNLSSGEVVSLGLENPSVPIYVDKDIFNFKFFAFTPANKRKSLKISTNDLLRIYENIRNPVTVFYIDSNGSLILEELKKEGE